MRRRDFLRKSALSATGIYLGKPLIETLPRYDQNIYGIRNIDKNLAIAMWDFSWMLRHYKGGGFEDFDRALSGLAERGYNAVRIDCFPYLVAPDNNGRIQDTFYHPKNDWSPALWGNQYSTWSNPRKSLIEFLSKCDEYKIHVGLATWFSGHGTKRNEEVIGLDGFVRVWDETLSFIDMHGFLDKILYVDLLNEYPLWHGFTWLHNELASMSDKNEYAKTHPDVHLQEIDFQKAGNKKNGVSHAKRHNPLQEKFYKDFMTRAIEQLRKKWPRLDFFASLTQSSDVPWEEMDFTGFDALDSHVWFVHHPDFGTKTGYSSKIHSCQNDLGFEETYAAMKSYWSSNKNELISWMDNELRLRSEACRPNRMACGNTEGWGAIIWYEHPALDWEFIKEAGEICVDLSLKHGFKFICTSNFTHPHFTSLWSDIQWHRNITETIKKGYRKPGNDG